MPGGFNQLRKCELVNATLYPGDDLPRLVPLSKSCAQVALIPLGLGLQKLQYPFAFALARVIKSVSTPAIGYVWVSSPTY